MINSSLNKEPIIENRKIYFIVSFFLIFIVLLIGRLWYLQILKGSDFLVASERNRVREVTRLAPRGLIFDRSGSLMLANRPFFDLVVIPQYLHKSDKTLKIISELFHIPFEQIEKKIKESSGIPKYVPIRIKQNLSLHEVAMIESVKFFLPGVDVDTVPRRDYIRNESAHLLGYLGEVDKRDLEALNTQFRENPYRPGSIIGKFGVEKKYEQQLRGAEGKDYLQVDALGRLQSSDTSTAGLNNINPRRGNDIYLTIDADVQRAASEAFRNKNGAVVALNPQNGEILAYISHPTFNLAAYQDGLSSEDVQTLHSDPFKPLLDKTTGGAYPPGSTFKIITAIAALEEGVVTPERTFSCGGVFTLGNGKWRCWKKEGHGAMNMRRALEQSCDVYFYQIGNLLGIEKIYKWAHQFGLGEKSDLNLNFETSTIAPNTEWKLRTKKIPWQFGDTINVSIGQGFNLLTPLQVVNMAATLANGGKLYRPYLLKKVVDQLGNSIGGESSFLKRTLVFKPENLAIVKGGLFDVVNTPSGTGKKARVTGFTVAGKSGTAQTAALRKAKDMDDVAFQQRDHAWFVGYSPSEVPEIAVITFSEYDGGGGGAQAAPIVQKVIEAYWKKKMPEKFIQKSANIVFEKKQQSPNSEATDSELLPPSESEIPEGDLFEDNIPNNEQGD